MGGKLEGLYFAFGEKDVYVLCDFPTNLSAAALGTMASSSGMVRTKITPLLTVEETDEVLTKKARIVRPALKPSLASSVRLSVSATTSQDSNSQFSTIRIGTRRRSSSKNQQESHMRRSLVVRLRFG